MVLQASALVVEVLQLPLHDIVCWDVGEWGLASAKEPVL